MGKSRNDVLAAVSAALLSSAALASAQAQGNPEAGDQSGAAVQGGAQFGGTMQVQGGAQPAQPEGSWQPSTGQLPPPMPGQPMPDGSMPADGSMLPPPDGSMLPPEAASPGDSDHAAAVGHFGIGFFGVQNVPVMGCDTGAVLCAAVGDATVSAPTIGVRYWLSEGLGIEAALGLNVTSTEAGALQTSAFAFALHGGVPLALAHSKHFVFQVVPQVNFGMASGSYEVPGTTSDVSGLLIEAGARAGAEIHFGFIDIPQLSLQGTVGLAVRHESRSADTTAGVPAVTATVEQSQTFLGTSVDGEPWDIFLGSLSAVYYFF